MMMLEAERPRAALRQIPYRVISYWILVTLVIAVFLPLLYVVNTALKSSTEFYRNVLGIVSSPQWTNFVTAFRSASMATYFLNSIFLTAAVAVITPLICSMAAYPISRRLIRGANFLYTLFMLGIFLPGGLIPTYMLLSRLGLTRQYLGAIVLYVSGSISISLFILCGFLKNIPRELDEAAIIDGCSYPRLLVQIIIPLLKVPIATIMALTSIGVWNDFFTPLIYLKASQRTLPAGIIAFQGQFVTQWPLLMAGSLIAMLPIVFFYSFLQRFMVESITAGAIKG